MQIHPAADVFPQMTDEEFQGLKSDISRRGLLEPVWVVELVHDPIDLAILDGRHRWRACEELGIACKWRIYEGDDPLGFVVALNLKRRHLTQSQKAMVALAIEVVEAQLARERQGTRTDLPVFMPEGLGHEAREKAAHAVGVSPRYVQDAKLVQERAPELAQQIRAGALTITAAVAILKRDDRLEALQEQAQQLAFATPTAPQGLFHVIAIDPPWPYEDGGESSYHPDGRRAANPYPEMSLDAIAELRLPAADDCILWLWTTHQFMRHSFALLDGWQFKEKAILTWVKDRMGLGHWLRSQSEFCIMAVKGSPLVNLTNQTTILHGPLREHSRKPDEFYAMVDALCIGRKLDFFSREPRPGWEQFGDDTQRFAA